MLDYQTLGLLRIEHYVMPSPIALTNIEQLLKGRGTRSKYTKIISIKKVVARDIIKQPILEAVNCADRSSTYIIANSLGDIKLP